MVRVTLKPILSPSELTCFDFSGEAPISFLSLFTLAFLKTIVSPFIIKCSSSFLALYSALPRASVPLENGMRSPDLAFRSKFLSTTTVTPTGPKLLQFARMRSASTEVIIFILLMQSFCRSRGGHARSTASKIRGAHALNFYHGLGGC